MINWSSKNKEMVKLFLEGKKVAEIAELLEVSYSSLCKYLRTIQLDSKGKLKKNLKRTESFLDFFENFIMKEYDNITDICNTFGLTPQQVQYYMKETNTRREWNFKDSSSANIAIGRKAELFVKSLPQVICRKDAIKTESKSPYDLIIREVNPNKSEDKLVVGGVDVKATKLRVTEDGKGHRWKFNVSGATSKEKKGKVKFVICVGYNEDYTEELMVLAIPYNDIKGSKSISVSYEHFKDSKYYDYLFDVSSEKFQQELDSQPEPDPKSKEPKLYIYGQIK